MSNEELFEAIDNQESITQRYLGLSIGKFLILVLLVLIAGVYIGILLYGTNSLEIFLSLDEYENYLQGEIDRLRSENAQLQKEYFELKEISAK